MLRNRERATRRPRLALGLGFLLPLAACYGVFAARGVAKDLVFGAPTHNLEYAATPSRRPAALARAAPLARCRSCSRPHPCGGRPGARGRFSTGPGGHWRPPRSARWPARSWAFRLSPRTTSCRSTSRSRSRRLPPPPRSSSAEAAPAGAGAGVAERALAGFTAAKPGFVLRPVSGRRGGAARVPRVENGWGRTPATARGPLFVWALLPQIYVEAGLRRVPLRRAAGAAHRIGAGQPGRASRANRKRLAVLGEHRDLLIGDLQRRRRHSSSTRLRGASTGGACTRSRNSRRLEAFVRNGHDAVAIVDGVWIWRRSGWAGRGEGAVATRRPRPRARRRRGLRSSRHGAAAERRVDASEKTTPARAAARSSRASCDRPPPSTMTSGSRTLMMVASARAIRPS